MKELQIKFPGRTSFYIDIGRAVDRSLAALYVNLSVNGGKEDIAIWAKTLTIRP